MSLSLVTPAARRPLALELLRAHLRLDDPPDEEIALLDTYLQGVTSDAFGIGGYTGRALITETYDQVFSGWGCAPRWLRLSRSKVQAVSSVTYTDTAGATQTLSPSLYRLTDEREPASVVPAIGATWPAVHCEGKVTVRYTAGYGDSWNDIPAHVRVALMQVAAHWYRNREAWTERKLSPVEHAARDIFLRQRVY